MSDVDSDQAPDFRRLVLEAWQGEVYGTEVDGALVDRLRVSEASAKTRELTVLEEHMERQLAHLMERLGIEPDLGDTLVVADQDIRDQGSSTWHELLPTGDGQTDRVVNNVLAHERALSRSARRSWSAVETRLPSFGRCFRKTTRDHHH